MLKKPNPLIYENKDNILLDFTITHSADSTPTVTFCNSISKYINIFY